MNSKIPKFIIIDKPEGITPIDYWKEYRRENLTPPTIKGGICGKLDPMATGKMLVLLDDECKNQATYLKMDKTYTFDVIIGLATDTDDILGLTTDMALSDPREHLNEVIQALNDYRTTKCQQFHNFSAVTAEGRETEGGPLVRRSLWYWSKLGLTGNQVKAPSKEIRIYSMEIGEPTEVGAEEFRQESLNRLSKLRVDPNYFRVADIISKWQNLKTNEIQLLRIPVTISVSTGTYIRQIVRDIREKLRIPLLCDKICRIDIRHKLQPSQFNSYLIGSIIVIGLYYCVLTFLVYLYIYI